MATSASIPVIEYFGGKLIEAEPEVEVEGLTVSEDTDKTTYRLSSSRRGPPVPRVMAVPSCRSQAIMAARSVHV